MLLALPVFVCEIRRVNLQERLRKAVSDHGPSLATLRYDLEVVIPKVGQMWQPLFEDPLDIHGQAFCTCVRQMVLRMRELRKPIPGDTLLTSRGSGLSVQIADSRGMDFRARRWPAKVLHGERVRVVTHPTGGDLPVLRPPKAQVDEQMLLDEDEPAQLFPSPIVTPAGTPDIFALWWPTDDGWGLSEAVLAFVVDVDNASRVQILATEPLPPVTDSPLVTPSAQGQGPKDDFTDYEKPVLGTGEDPDEPA